MNALTGPGVGSSRGALWLPLLRRLAEEVPNSYVWKNVDPALEGIGDIDYCARTADWPTINLVFRRWALNAGLGPVIVCRHVPDVMFLVVPDSTSDSLYELDVRDRIKLRGTTVFHCEEGLPLAQTDARGFRRLRPGAEGVVKLVLHGVAPGGLARPAALDKERVAMLIKSDPRGARDATRLFGMASGPLRKAAKEVTRGGWNRRAMTLVDTRTMAKVLVSPKGVWGRVRYEQIKSRCPVITAIVQHKRRVPGDRSEWLRLVAETHDLGTYGGEDELASA